MDGDGGRRWVTPDGRVLVEGEPSPVDFEGVPLPGVVEAHAYELRDGSGQVLKTFQAERKRIQEYHERFWITSYQVVGDQLIKFDSYCFEESTYDTPFAHEAEKSVVMTGLKPV